MASKLVNASTIVALDFNTNRLELAKKLGATHTILLNRSHTVEHILSELKQIRSNGFHYTVDTSGANTALQAGFECLQSFGTAALIGGSQTSVPINMAHLLHGRSVRGIIQGDSVSKIFLPQLIELWEQGKFPFHELITFYDGLESINTAIEQSKSEKFNVIKPVIRL